MPKSLQLILQISAIYRLVIKLSASRLVTNVWVAHAKQDFQEQCQTVFYAMLCLSLIASDNVYKTIIRFVFLISGIIKVLVSIISLSL